MLCAFACVGLGIAVQVYTHREKTDEHHARRVLMSVEGLPYPHPGRVTGGLELPTGPFDVWDGEWWRIPISAFHHGNWWHLATNVTSLWFLGALLEPRCPRLAYVLLLLGSATVTMLLQYLNGDYAVGISGTVCAQLGALLAIRRRYPELQEILSPPFIALSMIMLLSGLVINQFPELMQGVGIANLAHFTGLGYGWLFGAVYSAPYVHPRVMRSLFWGMHVFIWPAMNYSVEPMFNAEYHWYRGFEADALSESIYHYQTAAKLEPSYMPYWEFLTQAQHRSGNPLGAWESSLMGLRHNRMDQRGVRLTQMIWRALPNRVSRLKALAILNDVFGDEAKDWGTRLRLDGIVSLGGTLVLVPNQTPPGEGILLTREQMALLRRHSAELKANDHQLEGSRRNRAKSPVPTVPPIDEDHPGSAREGVLM